MSVQCLPGSDWSFCPDAGARARLRSKQALLATLMERVGDSNAYTRSRVLQTWAHLAEVSCIPLGHWVCVTELAIGGDPSALTSTTVTWITQLSLRRSSSPID